MVDDTPSLVLEGALTISRLGSAQRDIDEAADPLEEGLVQVCLAPFAV